MVSKQIHKKVAVLTKKVAAVASANGVRLAEDSRLEVPDWDLDPAGSVLTVPPIDSGFAALWALRALEQAVLSSGSGVIAEVEGWEWVLREAGSDADALTDLEWNEVEHLLWPFTLGLEEELDRETRARLDDLRDFLASKSGSHEVCICPDHLERRKTYLGGG